MDWRAVKRETDILITYLKWCVPENYFTASLECLVISMEMFLTIPLAFSLKLGYLRVLKESTFFFGSWCSSFYTYTLDIESTSFISTWKIFKWIKTNVAKSEYKSFSSTQFSFESFQKLLIGNEGYFKHLQGRLLLIRAVENSICFIHFW